MNNRKDKRATSTERGYDARWRRATAAYRRANPWCVECLKMGIHKRATVVDHIKPHKGDYDLFWDETNWQRLCDSCHNRKTAREDGGYSNPSGTKDVGGCGIDGMPLHEDHPWRQKASDK